MTKAKVYYTDRAEYRKAAKEKREKSKLAVLKNAIDGNTEESIKIDSLNYDVEAVKVPVVDINT